MQRGFTTQFGSGLLPFLDQTIAESVQMHKPVVHPSDCSAFCPNAEK